MNKCNYIASPMHLMFTLCISIWWETSADSLVHKYILIYKVEAYFLTMSL